MRKEDDFIIVPMTKAALSRCGGENRYCWNGTAAFEWKANHLGVYSKYWNPREIPTVVVCESPQVAGWGFGARYGAADKQGYSWAGKELPRTVFEIAVKSGELTEAEARRVLKPGNPRIGTAEAPKEEGGWQVVFRSHDASIWNEDVRSGPDHFATALEVLPEGVRYLRLTHGKSKDFVIVEMTNELLLQRKDNGKIGWDGVTFFDHQGYHLGVYSKTLEKSKPWVPVCGAPYLSGWGFGSRWGSGDVQGYSWAGKEIPRTVFEIAVKRDDLTKAEKAKLLQ
jgi:hypothetical protein